jgi:DNA-binding NarL/FixJ family response regulator
MLASSPRIEVIGQAASGAEAVELARRHHPDVVLMDVRMPGMSGAEATAAILAQIDTAVVAITAYDSSDALFNMLDAGALHFLFKDDPREELVKGVLAHEGERVLSARASAYVLDRLAQVGAGLPQREAAERFTSLTERERDVAILAAAGKSNKEIAELLFISESTMKPHLEQARIKMGANSRTMLGIMVDRAGFGPSTV